LRPYDDLEKNLQDVTENGGTLPNEDRVLKWLGDLAEAVLLYFAPNFLWRIKAYMKCWVVF
jgi:hypothetical protein